MRVIADIIGNVVQIKHRRHLVAARLLHGAVDRCHAGDLSAVIADGLHAPLHRKSGGHTCHQDQDMLIADHGLGIVPEDDLAVAVILRRYHIDSLVAVNAAEAALGQLLRQAGADHLCAVQAQNGIHQADLR